MTQPKTEKYMPNLEKKVIAVFKMIDFDVDHLSKKNTEHKNTKTQMIVNHVINYQSNFTIYYI